MHVHCKITKISSWMIRGRMDRHSWPEQKIGSSSSKNPVNIRTKVLVNGGENEEITIEITEKLKSKIKIGLSPNVGDIKKE